MYEKISIPSITPSSIKDQFFTVLSVELGNTTIKSIIITTNIKTNQSFQINKLVNLTRDIRPPKESEEVFGYTIWNKELSKEAIEESISKTILDSLEQVNMTTQDIDFVVRSTGVVAISSLSEEMGLIIKALSDACLNIGIKPSQMTAPFSINNIPEHIRKFSFFNNIQFDGSIVGVAPPKTTGILSNEMEGELVTAGIKLASKSSSIDYRNPIISIDMGTTLAGQIIDDSKPYANLLCNYVGLAGGISDILLRGCGIIDENYSTIDLENTIKSPLLNEQKLHEITEKLHKYVDIMEVPSDVQNFGLVNVYSRNKKEDDVKIIGSRINDEEKLVNTFNKYVDVNNLAEVLLQIDDFYAYYIKRLIDESTKMNLLSDEMTLGITGRAGTTGQKPHLIHEYLKDRFNEIIFAEDGLALGALMMARCMNSLGTPTNPIGGSKKGFCIMQQRNKKNNY
ncbi:MAG: methanogenesis marker 14 protein [Methanosphaera stadtmanae]|nr:methanogenesis marker 14 protein [Methanosphaera stadtmanae]